MAPRKRIKIRGDHLPKGRLMVAILAALLTVGTSLIVLPTTRHDIHALLGRFIPRGATNRTTPVIGPRESASLRDIPKKLTTRVLDAAPSSGATPSSAA